MKPQMIFDWTRASMTALCVVACFYFTMTGNWQALLAGIGCTYWMARAFKAESIMYIMGYKIWRMEGGQADNEKAS